MTFHRRLLLRLLYQTEGGYRMKTCLEIRGIPMEVEYAFHPFRPGSREKYGQKLEPDEPAHFEITDIYSTGTKINLLEFLQQFAGEGDLLTLAEELLWEYYRDHYQDSD